MGEEPDQKKEVDKRYREMINFVWLAGTLLMAIPLIFFLFNDFTEFLSLIGNFGALLIVVIAGIEIAMQRIKGKE